MPTPTGDPHGLSRRRFLWLSLAGVSLTSVTSLLAACQPSAPAGAPTSAAPTAAAAKPSVATSPAAGASPAAKPAASPSPAAGASPAASPAAAASPSASPAAAAAARPTGEPISVGVVEPLTGDVAASGGYVRMGAEIGRDWVNDAGGVLGRPLELKIEDDKSDPKEAATAVEKLIVSDKVPALMGCWGSSMTLAAMPKLEQYGVPMLVETSSAASITTSGNPWVFRIAPPSSKEAAGIEKYWNDLNIKKADFLSVNTDFGKGAAQAFGDLVKRKGGQVGTQELMEQSATDMGAQLTRIQQSGGDTLFVTTEVQQLVLILKQMQERSLKARVIATGGSVSPDQLIEQAGAAAEGHYYIVFFMPWFPQAMPTPQLAQRFIDDWRKRGNPEPGMTEGFRGVDGIMTLAAAINKAGKPEPMAVRDALWTVEVQGINGPIKFDKEGPAGKESGQSSPSIFLVTIQSGKVALPPFVKTG